MGVFFRMYEYLPAMTNGRRFNQCLSFRSYAAESSAVAKEEPEEAVFTQIFPNSLENRSQIASDAELGAIKLFSPVFFIFTFLIALQE